METWIALLRGINVGGRLEWDGARHHFQRVLELDPDYVQARLWHGIFLGFIDGDDAGALVQLERAVATDPLWATGWGIPRLSWSRLDARTRVSGWPGTRWHSTEVGTVTATWVLRSKWLDGPAKPMTHSKLPSVYPIGTPGALGPVPSPPLDATPSTRTAGNYWIDPAASMSNPL